MSSADIHISMPDWLGGFIADQQQLSTTVESRMRLVIELARLNVEQRTGGPFAAAIFNIQTHELLSAGVNLVLPSNCSMAHAEMIAISTAQQSVGNYDLGALSLPPFELVSSSQPCAMCFGALPWSGIRHLVCGARDEDVRAIGFDEGPKHPRWIEILAERNITVERDVCRGEAVKILNSYAESGELIYNARQGVSDREADGV